MPTKRQGDGRSLERPCIVSHVLAPSRPSAALVMAGGTFGAVATPRDGEARIFMEGTDAPAQRVLMKCSVARLRPGFRARRFAGGSEAGFLAQAGRTAARGCRRSASGRAATGHVRRGHRDIQIHGALLRAVRDGIPVFRARLTLLTRNEDGHPLVLASTDLRNLGTFRPNRTDCRRRSAGHRDGTAASPSSIGSRRRRSSLFAGADRLGPQEGRRGAPADQ